MPKQIEPSEKERAESLMRSVLNHLGVISGYIAEGGDCDPQLIATLNQMNRSAETLRNGVS